MVVLDASALLAFLNGEAGADVVEEALLEGSCVSTVNWSETAQRTRALGGDWTLARALLLSYGLDLVAVTEEDAETAAELWVRGSGLSLGDRVCLALGRRLGVTTLTADRSWGSDSGVRQIR